MRDKISFVIDSPKMRTIIDSIGIFGAALYLIFLAIFLAGCVKEGPYDKSAGDPLAIAAIAETFPANLADTVVINPVVAVTFKSTVPHSEVSTSTITLLEGLTPIQGTFSISGNTIIFKPAADLKSDSKYTATVKFSLKNGPNNENTEYSWKFNTGKKRRLSTVSVMPLMGATSVAIDVQPAVTFSDELTSSTIKTTTFTLKQGVTTVTGTVSYSGKIGTFKPSANLKANTTYTGKIAFGTNEDGDDEGGDNKASGNYTWSFTTTADVDITPPTISSVAPANNATAIAINSNPTVTFSEGMNASTITTTTFTLKQGTTVVAGTVSYSGTTASFTPAVCLSANLVYTGTITTGAKDVTGNSIAANYSWSFTTVAATTPTDVVSPTVLSVIPANNATLVAVNANTTITFSEAMTASTINSTTVNLKQGTTTVAGTVTYTGTTATFMPTSALTGGTVYTGTVTTGAKDAAGNSIAANYTWSFTTVPVVVADIIAPTVLSVIPANNATLVAVNANTTITFSEAMTASTINSTTVTLKQGATSVAGTVAYTGTTATFTPTSALTSGTVYTGTVTTGAKDAAGNAIAANYTWSFTTLAATPTDVIAPTVLSVIPANNATIVAVNANTTITFSEAMTASTINSTTVTLKQGATSVAGTVAYTGTTATFTPTSALTGGTVYTGTVTTGAKDAAGNAIAANYTWSFTTAPVVVADVTPPTVITIVPASGATSIALNSKVTAEFSEEMNASTITTATFTVKQGTTAVAGTVAYTGTTATFTPSSALVAGTVYTATVTTGAKDVAGNAIAASKDWSFTTLAAVPAGISFAASVVPVLGKCQACHTHRWTPSAVASTYYANLVSGGYVNAASYTTSKIYTKVNGGHGGLAAADNNAILDWMKEGSKNN